MKRPTLTAPFRVVEQVNGMDYIPIAEVLDRLNTVLGTGKWSYSCSAWRDEHDPEYVIAKGSFTVHTLNDAGIASCLIEQYGGQKINRKSSGDKGIIDLGNDFKGAASDALKKCAMAIGVALYLPLGRTPHMAAQFDTEQKGEPTGAEDDGDQSGTAGGDGNGSSQPALTPGFSGDPL